MVPASAVQPPEPRLDDARSADPVERLLEDSWLGRSRRVSRRELIVELTAGALFLCCAIPMAAGALATRHLDLPLAALLVVLYAMASRLVELPVGAGYAVPTYVLLVPMLLLLPPGTVPLLAASGLVLGCLGQAATGRVGAERLLFAVPDAWHAVGPALVLTLAGTKHPDGLLALVYAAAFVSGCLLDLISSAVRERAILGVGSGVQLRVIAVVWLIDACFAPVGLLLAHAMRQNAAAVLLVVPLGGVLALAARDRSARIEQAQERLDLLARERSRLQSAVRRLGDALAAKLDLAALTDVVLGGSIEALDATAGRLVLTGPIDAQTLDIEGPVDCSRTLRLAADTARLEERPCQLEEGGVWALALPMGFQADAGTIRGAIALARPSRPFEADEQSILASLAQRAREAAADILSHQELKRQATTDALTRLGNRRKLAADFKQRVVLASEQRPLLLVLFDLDGFKHYNDTFGHPAGDGMLARLSARLEVAATPFGAAYRLGGDEFCVLLSTEAAEQDAALASVTRALEDKGEDYAIGASHGKALVPGEAGTLEQAMRVADERLYRLKARHHSEKPQQARGRGPQRGPIAHADGRHHGTAPSPSARPSPEPA